MNNKRGRYRSDTVRLKSWDYGWNGVYFVTICTNNRLNYFGDIPDTVEAQNLGSLQPENGIVQLSEMGKIAESCWRAIPEHFPFVKLGEFVIMPNHVHGIIIIKKNNDGRNNADAQTKAYKYHSRQQSLNSVGPQSRNLPSIIRGFKVGVTKRARKIDPGFKWQPKYYDHIIRDRKSFETISDYIKRNPEKWRKDEYFKS